MNLLRRLAQRLGLMRARGAGQFVLIRVDVELLSDSLTWGREVEALAEHLSALSVPGSGASFEGVDRASDGFRLIFHADDAQCWLNLALPSLQASSMRAGISVCLSDQAVLGQWHPVNI